jgi:hypothetical protein
MKSGEMGTAPKPAVNYTQDLYAQSPRHSVPSHFFQAYKPLSVFGTMTTTENGAGILSRRTRITQWLDR